jgi:multiple sugar transport system permease protein
MKHLLNRLSPYVFVGPAALVMAVACLYPVLTAGKLAFYDWSLGTAWDSAVYVGSAMFTAMLSDPAVFRSLVTTLLFAAIVVVCEMSLGICLALLLERPIRGMTVFRMFFILPMMVAPIVVGLIWRYLFDTQYGLINQALELFGIGAKAWLADPQLAFVAIVIADIWQWTPFVFIMVMAGLQNLDGSVMEAAKIDGASALQAIFRVKLPLLMPIIVVTLLMRLIDAFRVLEVIYMMTFGGPADSTEILSLHIYKVAFVSQKLGYASAISILLLVVVLSLSLCALMISNPLKGGKKA